MISMIRSALSRKVAIGAVPILAAAAFTVGGATMASAATQSADHGATAAAGAVPFSSFNDCETNFPGDLCWWVGANQTGVMHPVRDAIANWSTQKEPTCSTGTWNDCASTLDNANTQGEGAQVYENANFTGAGFCLRPGSKIADLTHQLYSNTSTFMEAYSAHSVEVQGHHC
jgi:hypothetical protein